MTTEEMQQHIAALLAEIPEDEREEFETYYQMRLSLATQEANQRASDSAIGAADPDEVEAALVERLIREADGRDNPDGMGAVPTRSEVYELIPPESDPRLLPAIKQVVKGGWLTSEQLDAMTPARWAGVVIAPLALLIWLAASLFGGAGAPDGSELASTDARQAVHVVTTPTATATATPIVDYSGGSDITVAYPSSLELGESHIYRVLASSSELGGAWAPELLDGTAAWLNGSYVNSVFCLPSSAEKLLRGLKRGAEILMRPANGAVRHYEVMRARTVGRQQTEVMDQRRAGMTLLLCGTPSNQRFAIEAVYRPDMLGEAVGAPGDRLEIAGVASIQLHAVRTITTTEEHRPGLAVAEFHADVANLSGGPLSWSDLADYLIIAGAAAENVSRPTPLRPHESTGVTFHYLVPQEGATATWRFTAVTGESIAFTVRIPQAPAAKRHPALRATITPADVRLHAGQQRRSGRRGLAVTAQVTALGSAAATLTPGDVTVWIGERALPPAVGSSPLPVQFKPGQQRKLNFVFDIPDVGVVELQIKRQRWRITLP